jgi:hypothetical protein
MKEHHHPFLWIDLVKPAPDCEEAGFGVYVLGPSSYDPESVKGEDALQLLCWGHHKRVVRVKGSSVIDPFGPIFTPELLARVWQAPYQDVLAVSTESSFAEDLSSSQVRYLAAEPLRIVLFVASLEWNTHAFVRNHEPAQSPYQEDPRYRAIAERLQVKRVPESIPTPDLRRNAVGIPISIRILSKEVWANGIFVLQSEQPAVANIMLFMSYGGEDVLIEPGSIIEYRSKIVASVLQLHGKPLFLPSPVPG